MRKGIIRLNQIQQLVKEPIRKRRRLSAGTEARARVKMSPLSSPASDNSSSESRLHCALDLVQEVIFRVDTLVLFFRRRPGKVRGEIQRILGRPVPLSPVKGKSGFLSGYRLRIQKLTLDELRRVAHLLHGHSFSLSRVDIFADFLTNTEA